MKLFSLFLLLSVFSLITGCRDKDKSKEVSTPNVGIHQAILMGDIEAVQQHLQAGTDVDEDEWTYGSSPLITAAAFGEFEIAKLLINAGANLNFQNDEGSTPLITASAFNHPDIAQLLIASGANLDIVNNDGSTALILATLYGDVGLVKSLLENKANKEIINKFGRSAITIIRAPFEETKEILVVLEKALKIKLDYEKIKEGRPAIAEMLK